LENPITGYTTLATFDLTQLTAEEKAVADAAANSQKAALEKAAADKLALEKAAKDKIAADAADIQNKLASAAVLANENSELKYQLLALQKTLNALTVQLKRICSAKTKPKGC
jgi:hypothetical protein